MNNKLTPMSEIRESITQPQNLFASTASSNQPTKVDSNSELVDNVFKEAVVHEIANSEDLKNDVLATAKEYTKTKMDVIRTEVDTEKKEANFNNKRDACESYGFKEKTTPIWATKFMTFGYSVMLAIWLFIGTFTFMPVIFIMKKVQVGLKHTWLAIVVALLLYAIPTVLIPLVAFIPKV